MPSTLESFGIVQLEAMATGLPVVIADLPGARGVSRDGEHGVHVAPGDLDDLERGVRALVDAGAGRPPPDGRGRTCARGRALHVGALRRAARGRVRGGRVKRLLLVTQRPLEYGGGGSVRWQYLQRELPHHGWEVEEVSARPNPTANAASTDVRAARLAEARAKVMTAIGAATRPAYRRLGIQPEAFPPNALWGRDGPERRAPGGRARAPGRRVGHLPAAVRAVRRAGGRRSAAAGGRDARPVGRQPLLRRRRDAAGADREAGVRTRRRRRHRDPGVRGPHARAASGDRAAATDPAERVRPGPARPAGRRAVSPASAPRSCTPARCTATGRP